MAGRSVIVVIEPQALVRLDLVCQVQEAVPGAEVRAFADADRALAQAADGVSIDGVIASLRAGDLRASGLADLARGHGAWVVCVGASSAKEAEAAGWHYLAKPFFAEEAMGLFRRLSCERAEPIAD